MKKPERKEARFIEEYLIDLNATKAAIRSGFSAKSAREIGSRLLKKGNIQEAIARAQAKRAEKLEITADKWLRELALIGFGDIANYMTIDEGGSIIAKTFEEMPADASRALEYIEENRTIKESADGTDSNILNNKIRFKMHDKLKALEMIGKALGFLKDEMKVSGGLEVTLRKVITDARPKE